MTCLSKLRFSKRSHRKTFFSQKFTTRKVSVSSQPPYKIEKRRRRRRRKIEKKKEKKKKKKKNKERINKKFSN